ncbi:MAG: hypothetical protein NTX47_05400 [Candidatus Omnitrophica bacterium]|nr:hypothetical protein [Candidatus Omnitrophota bacterium]
MNKNKILSDNQGMILIVVFFVVLVLSILSIGMMLRMTTATRVNEHYRDSTEAFYLAEAAIDKAIAKLPSNTGSETGVSLGAGKYSLDIYTITAGKKWRVTGYGYVPDLPPASRTGKKIEAVVEKKDLGDNFWNNAIYSSGDINFKGSSYTVNGQVRFAGDVTGDVSSILPENLIEDPSISPLALLDFTSLKNIAISQIKPNGQNNLYTASDIADNKPFPASFWFDEANSIPNVVYVEADLIITGNTTAGGFIVVGGDVIEDVELKGNVTIEGCIYTRGYFENKGGGNALNVNGGIWAGNYATLRGNAKIDYNETYMDAIRNNIDPSTEAQLVSWREEKLN